MTDLILISHVRVGDPYEADVRALLNEAYPEGAPDELGLYYGKHGPPDATVLLRLAQRIVISRSTSVASRSVPTR